VKSKKLRFILVLHNIRSRFNVGSVFRTADAAGVDKIYLCGITPTPPHPKISKVALGAEKFVSFEKFWQIGKLLNKFKKEKIQIIALEQSRKSIPYFKFKPKFPLALILGSETQGLSSKILKKCDRIIEIPMYGKKESLNVSVACGIVVFKIARYLH
jgi:tRNA G18 (ribose-2'-O)-methylase SpoU